MLRNTKAKILNQSLQEVGDVCLDIQPYGMTYTYNNGYKVPMTHKIFCDSNDLIDYYSYFKLSDNTIYKVITLQYFSDYILSCCYECEVI